MPSEHEVASEGETGKVYRANFHDQEGRTVLVLRPGKQNTSSHDNQIRHLVYLLENAILTLPEGQEQMVWMIDFTGWSLTYSVPIKVARETANILQNHYPERLASALLFNPPRVFETFWKVVKYFLDMKTFHKFGGKNKAHYDHEEFSKMMMKDEIKSASFWGLDEKPSSPNLVTNGHSASGGAPESSYISA